MGDFNPLCTQLYYVYFNLFNIWVIMGIYGFIWGRLSAKDDCSSLSLYMTVKWDGEPVLFPSLIEPQRTCFHLFIYLIRENITH